MLQIVTPVALNDIEQEQWSPDRPRLRTRVAGAGDDEVGRRHQVGDPVGEAKRVHPRLARGGRREIPGQPPIPSGDGQHVDARVAERLGCRCDRAEPPGARHQQNAALPGRHAERRPR
jgi:hypothetical protein